MTHSRFLITLSRHHRRMSHSLSFQRPPLTLPHIRFLCTSNPLDMDPAEAEDLENKLDLISGRQGEPVKEVLLSPDGEQLQELTPESLSDPTFNWAAFERRFGLDAVTDEQNDLEWKKFEKSWEEQQRKHTDKRSPIHTPHHTASTSKGRWTKPNKFEASNASFEFVDDDAIDLNPYDHPPEPREVQSMPSPNNQRPTPSLFENIASEFGRDKLTQKASPSRKGRIQSTDPLEQHIFSNSDPMQHQPNRKRPGYERRVARMERQMEKIAELMLCDPNSEWSKEGGEVERVMLSPNMQNLSIAYNADGSRRDKKWWAKFNKKYAGMLRTRMASELRTKYVPRVFFQQGLDNMDAKCELDALFEQMEMERAERAECERKMDSGK